MLFRSVAAAVSMMGYAGELAWGRKLPHEGNSSYRNGIIDTIYHMTGEELAHGAKYELR